MPATDKIRIITWNIGGAKFLRQPEPERRDMLRNLRQEFDDLVRRYRPDIVLLQEFERYGDVHAPQDLVEAPRGYHCNVSIAIDTANQSHPTKWSQYHIDGGWPPGIYLAHGYGILWRRDIRHCSLWDFNCSVGPRIEKEIVHIETGLYTGYRDTEPRLAVVTHFVLGASGAEVDVLVVNLHLTTLKGEREGIPSRDEAGARMRLGQIDMILNGIVSRYNETMRPQYQRRSRNPPIWVIAGDFNCMPGSPEIRKLARMNFIDLNPNKGAGTKSSSFPVEKATITLDYIFAGPAYHALNRYAVEHEVQSNPLPLSEIKVSDHLPLLADLPLCLPGQS
jgi:endonuclease/exonuclease/phosphatase family metal-dependent hydrolase